MSAYIFIYFSVCSFQQITVYYNLPKSFQWPYFKHLSKGRNITQYWLRPLLSIDLKEFWQQKMWKTVVYIFKRSTTCVLIELQFQILLYFKNYCQNVKNKSAPRGCYSIWIFIAKSGRKNALTCIGVTDFLLKLLTTMSLMSYETHFYSKLPLCNGP